MKSIRAAPAPKCSLSTVEVSRVFVVCVPQITKCFQVKYLSNFIAVTGQLKNTSSRGTA